MAADLTPEQKAEAARLAGWNAADGDPPNEHTLPPDIDPELGHNGIAPTDAERIA